MKPAALIAAVLIAAPLYAQAQSTRAETSSANPAKQATTSTLVIMATGSQERRESLNPAIDALCKEFAADPGVYPDVVRLQTETDLSAALLELTPKDDREQKGAMLRQLKGALQAGAFQNCLDGSVPDRLIEPLEVVLFGISYGKHEHVNVSVSRYRVRDDKVLRLDAPYNAHVDLFRDVDVLGRCVGQQFWHHGGMSANECIQRIGFHSSVQPSVISSTTPIDSASESGGLVAKWWFWGAIGAIVGAATAGVVVATNDSSKRNVYPSCPQDFTCMR